jgi:hypothetical protein
MSTFEQAPASSTAVIDPPQVPRPHLSIDSPPVESIVLPPIESPRGAKAGTSSAEGGRPAEEGRTRRSFKLDCPERGTKSFELGRKGFFFSVLV